MTGMEQVEHGAQALPDLVQQGELLCGEESFQAMEWSSDFGVPNLPPEVQRPDVPTCLR